MKVTLKTAVSLIDCEYACYLNGTKAENPLALSKEKYMVDRISAQNGVVRLDISETNAAKAADGFAEEYRAKTGEYPSFF